MTHSSATVDLIRRFESVSFEDVHRGVLHLLPRAPARVLDVGAGSGRDAAALSRMGHQVWAVEPVGALRKAAQTLHAAESITWIDDRLPALALVRARRQSFDLILASAVWFFLDAPARSEAMPRLAELLAPQGLLIMSLKHDPSAPPHELRPVSTEEVASAAIAAGLKPIYCDERHEALGRSSVRWTEIVLQKAEGS